MSEKIFLTCLSKATYNSIKACSLFNA